jgi:hypothetical protein
MTNVNVTTTLTTPQSGTQTLTVPYGGRTFYLYNNSVQLATSTADTTCKSGGWDGSKCVKAIDCTWSAYSPTAACPTACGQAASQLTRSTVGPYYNGANCSGSSTLDCPATVSCADIDGKCDTATHYKCSIGTVTNKKSATSKWTWSCDGSSNGGSVTECTMLKKKPVYIEN